MGGVKMMYVCGDDDDDESDDVAFPTWAS